MDRQTVTVYLDNKQIEDLKLLSDFTRIKRADYIREGVDMVLEKYQSELKKAKRR